MRLQLPNHLVCLWPVVVFLHVNLPRLVGTTIPAVTAIGTIEPYLEYLAIVGEKLTELVAEIFHICRSGIRGMVAVPGREIDCKLQSFLAASLGQFLHHIALTVLPRRVLHRILCISRWPHAETAMVLGGEDNALHSCLFANPRPLPAVETRRIEQLRVLVSVTPFLICVSVQRVMYECIHLHLLPSVLVCCRDRHYRLDGLRARQHGDRQRQ